ncbi:MAG: cell division protein FtsZ [Eubacteriaceae bacterium]|jgi:cell division protein FtsZ|nr:cell division protein FtsZ [Eubacteriaceae bacterium]
MPYEFLPEDKAIGTANIKVIGVGGAGNNAVNRMIESGLQGVTFYVVNTDSQALNLSRAENKLQIGAATTGGLGAGANPEVGEKSAEENIEDIKTMLEGADLVFITAGMGGGTGTGASHVIARVAHEMGLLIVGVVTRPFNFEGKVRKINADLGIQLIRDFVDALVVIPNDRLLQMANPTTTFNEALRMADEVLLMGVKGITDLIATPALINLDFADVKTIIQNAGLAHMGMGIGTGDEKAVGAATQAIQSPLLETNIDGATGVLINIMGGEQLTLFEIEKIAEIVRQEAHPEANIIFGACIDSSLDTEIKVTVLATGFSPAGSKISGKQPPIDFVDTPVPPNKGRKANEPRQQRSNPWPSFLDDFN